MKRNANQSLSSPNRCALCGDYFCLIRSTPNQCGFCQKILCNKCCVDTHYNVDDDTMTLNGTTNSRRNSITSINNAPPNNKVVVYLCRLCSEQREVLNECALLIVYSSMQIAKIFTRFFFFFLLKVSKKIRSLVSKKISKLYIKCRKVQLNV